MLLEDFISSQSSAAHTIDQIPQHFLPNSYGLAPLPPTNNNIMEAGPPPVTRLVPDNLAAAARLPTNSTSRIEAVKSLLCSESDSEFGALSGDSGKLAKNPSLPQPKPATRISSAASFSAVPHPLPRMSSVATNISTALGDYRTPHHPYHIPLMIKIPTKVRLPPQKDGKRINQHTYKAHAPGDGLLKIDKKPEMAEAVPGVPLVSTDRPYQTTVMMTDHGILNIISTNEPGSKVPTPPASYLSVKSNSTSSSSAALSLASTSPSDDQTHTAMAMTSLSLTQSAATNGAKPKRSRSGGGLGKKRTSFTRNQVYAMERRFDQQRYLTSVERKEFSNSIGLDDHHVKIWFQNRRSKLKRQKVGSTTNIQANPPAGTNSLPPQHLKSQIKGQVKSGETSSSAASFAHYQAAVPTPLHPSNPTPDTGYIPNLNGSTPSCMSAPMMAPQCGAGVVYAPMNSTTSSVPNSYSSSIPTGVNALASSAQGAPAAAAPNSFDHPYAPQYNNSNAVVMMSSATHSHMPVPTMTTQVSAMHGTSTVGGVTFQPSYGYAHDLGVDQGAAFAAQGSRSSSPFGNFPFSPGFNCVPEDAGVSFFNQMQMLPPVNMI